MNTLKKIFGICLTVLLLAGIVALCFFYRNWTWRFRSELDQFFGEGNWECLSEETKETIMNQGSIDEEEYQKWYIVFKDSDGEQFDYIITNLVYKMSKNEHLPFSPKRYSARQALILELMDISFELVGDAVLDDVLRPELPENAADCLRVSISYQNGNPPPKFYDELFRQEWFNAKDARAEDYLNSDLYEFYLDIFAYNYMFDKLEPEEKQAALDAFDDIEEKLLSLYGENASFRIYFDKEHNVEYLHGVKQ